MSSPAVNFARDAGLDLSVRGGGHSAPGFGTNDDGVVLDLSPMRHVHVDPRARTARAGGGATWGDFNYATHAYGLATTGGIVSTTGIGGLTLGGGIGYLTRGYGLSIDNLVSAEVVTADGQVRNASATENADLFWAIRGGGGNFGVVTSFEFQLHPVNDVYVGLFFYELEHAGTLLRFFREFIQNAPEAYGAFPAFQIAPPLEFIPADRHGDTFCLAVVHWAGPLDEGETRDEAVPGPRAGRRRDGRPHAVPRAQCGVRSDLPQGHPQLLEGHLRHRTHRRRHRGAPRPRPAGPGSECHHAPVPDQRRVPSRRRRRTPRSPTETRPSPRSSWPPGRTPPTTPSASNGCATTTKRLAPHSEAGGYVNFMADDDQARVQDNYRGNYTRLTEVKRTYDPDNLFHLNQNIPPAS